jgi:hypothetical protein
MPDTDTDTGTGTDVDDEFIEVEGFLYISEKGGVRATKKRCDLKAGEIRTSVSFKIPRALFEKDAIKVQVVIPDGVQTRIDAQANTSEVGSW